MFLNQFTLALVSRFTTTHHLNHLIAILCFNIVTKEFTEVPFLVLLECAANMFLPAHLDGPNECSTYSNRHSNVIITRVHTGYTVNDIVSVATLSSHHVYHYTGIRVPVKRKNIKKISGLVRYRVILEKNKS
jgi:hypothetical protein